MRVHLHQRDSKLISNRMLLDTGVLVEEIRQRCLQKIEIRPHKAILVAQLEEEHYRGGNSEFFLGD